MIKQPPPLHRIVASAAFALSCFGLLVWLWISFGGAIPLKPKGYRFEAAFREATLLVNEADVRIAGMDVGKVKGRELDADSGVTIAEIELDSRFAPIPADTRATLRTKGLLGETYVELTPGSGSAAQLADGGRLPAAATQEAVEIDEILSLFDRPTRRNFQRWIHQLARAIDMGRGEDLNDALGNLPRFVATGEDVLRVLHSQDPALRQLIRNSGRALEAVNERRGQLRELVGNANDTFGALASRNESLADAIFILPTFLDESRATLARLKTFAHDARPLVRDLQPVARELRPTLHNVGRLAPDLEALFRRLDPVIDESDETLPSAARYLAGAEPLFEALHPFLVELNPILSYLNFSQQILADYIANPAGNIMASLPPLGPDQPPRRVGRPYTMINARSGVQRTSPSYERGNTYPAPNFLRRANAFGIVESFDCSQPGGRPRDPAPMHPPCFVAPPSLYNGGQFPRSSRGEAPVRQPPRGTDGTRPADPDA